MFKKIMIVLIIIAMLGGGFYYYRSQQTSAQQQEAVVVETQELVLGNLTKHVTADGNVVVSEDQDVKTEVESLISSLEVEKGDLIAKGDLVAKLSGDLFRDQLQNLQIELEEANLNYEKMLAQREKEEELRQHRLNNARQEIEKAKLALEREKISLAEIEADYNNQIENIIVDLSQLKDDLAKKEYLLSEGAIAKNEVEAIRNKISNLKIEKDNLNKKLEKFLNQTKVNRLKIARTSLQQAESSIEQLKVEFADQNIFLREKRLAKLSIEKVKTKINEISDKLKKIDVYSPYTGTVIELSVQDGSMVEAGDTVIKVADISDLEIRALVDEVNINEVAVGQSVTVSSDNYNGILKGEVKEISPIAIQEGNINKYETIISLNEGFQKLKPGMFVSAEIMTHDLKDVFSLPLMAILGEEQKYVMVNDNGVSRKKNIETGLRNLSQVEIESGLEKGAEVIIGPFNILRNLQEGQLIQVKAEKNAEKVEEDGK